MNFIALVIALLIERLLGEHARMREPGWYRRYAAWLQGLVGGQSWWSGPFGLLLLVGIPTALVGIVHAALGGAFLSLLALIFSVAVLLFCLGPEELDAEVSAYVAAVGGGDEEGAAKLAAKLTGGIVPASGGRRNHAVAQGLLVEFNERSFGVLLWFVVLGPLGAILYRMSAFANSVGLGEDNEAFATAATRLHGILNWFPARLIALGFALAGSFEDAVTDWRSYYDRKSENFWQVNSDVIVAAGSGALRLGSLDDEDPSPTHGLGAVRSALALTLRTLILWVVLFGIFIMAGFAF